jgi:hypothetical protein
VLLTAWHDEHAAGRQHDLPLAGRLAQGDREHAGQHEEQLVGVRVGVPDVLALHLGDAHVVVVHLRDDARAPECVEARQGVGEGDRLGEAHPPSIVLRARGAQC